jgi:hypothetical protein
LSPRIRRKSIHRKSDSPKLVASDSPKIDSPKIRFIETCRLRFTETCRLGFTESRIRRNLPILRFIETCDSRRLRPEIIFLLLHRYVVFPMVLNSCLSRGANQGPFVYSFISSSLYHWAGRPGWVNLLWAVLW